jgi:ADP-heptose:LPS heptosyltransferase
LLILQAENVVNLVNKLSKDYGIVFFSEIAIEFQKHGVKQPVAIPQNIDLRMWAGIIDAADHFLGCDSVGQHIAYALDKTATVVIGSTFKENISYPDNPKFDILDMGEGARVYSPIRITIDELSDRTNEGIMYMNDKIEDVIVSSVNSMVKDGKPVEIPDAKEE